MTDAAVAVSSPIDVLKPPVPATEDPKPAVVAVASLSSGSDTAIAVKKKGGRPRSDMQHLKSNPWQQKQITFVFKKGELVPQAGDRAKARKEARERKALENSLKKEASSSQEARGTEDGEPGDSSSDSPAEAKAEIPSSSSSMLSKSLVDSSASASSSLGSPCGSNSASPSMQSPSASTNALPRQAASLDSVVSATAPPPDAKPDKKHRLTASSSSNPPPTKIPKMSSWTIEAGTGSKKRKGQQMSDKFRITHQPVGPQSPPPNASNSSSSSSVVTAVGSQSPAPHHHGAPMAQAALMGKTMNVVGHDAAGLMDTDSPSHKEAGAALLRLFGGAAEAGGHPPQSVSPQPNGASTWGSSLLFAQQLQQILGGNSQLMAALTASGAASPNGAANSQLALSRVNPSVMMGELQNILLMFRRQEEAFVQRYEELLRYEFALKQREASLVHREMELSDMAQRVMQFHHHTQNQQQQHTQHFMQVSQHIHQQIAAAAASAASSTAGSPTPAPNQPHTTPTAGTTSSSSPLPGGGGVSSTSPSPSPSSQPNSTSSSGVGSAKD